MHCELNRDFRSILHIVILVTLLGKCAAVPQYCTPNTVVDIRIDVSDPSPADLQLCTYPRDHMGSIETRSCHWRIRVVGARSPTQLALELMPTERYKRQEYRTFQKSKSMFTGFMSIETSPDTSPNRRHPWNQSFHFQLLSPRNSFNNAINIYLDVNSDERANVSDLFQLKVHHSNASTCSQGLMYHRGRCYAVRHTDRMAQAAGFRNESDIREFLNAYKIAVAEELDDCSSHPEMRLGMIYCDAPHSLLYWNQAACACIPVPLSRASRSLADEGNCASVRTDCEPGAPLMRPVSCSDPMPTLISFPSAPTFADLGAPTPRCPAEVQQRDCSQICQAKSLASKESGPTAWTSVTFSFGLLVIVVPCIIASTLCYRRHNSAPENSSGLTDTEDSAAMLKSDEAPTPARNSPEDPGSDFAVKSVP